MTFDEVWEAWLLWRAVRACETTRLHLGIHPPSEGGLWQVVATERDGDTSSRSDATLADALAALLRDLGEEVERPSAEAVRAAQDLWLGDACVANIRDLAAREPETVLDLIFGGPTNG